MDFYREERCENVNSIVTDVLDSNQIAIIFGDDRLRVIWNYKLAMVMSNIWIGNDEITVWVLGRGPATRIKTIGTFCWNSKR